MNAKNNKYRGAVFIQQALILAFVIVVGVVFLNDKSLSGSVGTIFDNGVELLTSALGNEHSNGGDSHQGGNSGNGSNGGTTNEGSSTEPSKPLPEDNPNFGQIQLEGNFGNTTLGNLGGNLLNNFYGDYWNQLPKKDQYNQYQKQDLDYISWSGNEVTLTFKPVNEQPPVSTTITVSNTSNFVNYLESNGIGSTGTLAIDNGGQVVQYNSDKTVYSSLDLLNKDGTEYNHYGY